MATTVFVQVIELVIALTVACGTSVDELTATVEVFVHPDVGCVTTKVYVPGAPTVVVNDIGELTPPNHVAVAPTGVAEPVNVTELTPHTNVCVPPALAIGCAKLLVTVATAVFVQPFVVLVVTNV